MRSILLAGSAWVALAVFFGAAAAAQQASAETDPARHVTINIEIHGLEETTEALRGAARSLASTLEDVRARRDDLTPEQLDRLAALAKEMNELVRSAERVTQASASALEKAREPVKAIVADAVSSARQSGVDPVLRSIHWSVTIWLVIAILGGLTALALALYMLFSTGRQLKEMVATLKTIAAEYEIVRRNRPGASAG
ncbi:MAG: hypothetical protein OEV81_16415 [Betaproteobacteria bacterium]|nr:hypothetical protein [Betaproteobacteria bacterium]MDH5220095.1 hypothetical protein [Betaproteobacteria bacterium]MDH5351441.1 hypothetical protein [Betaproteobacteria bacterium]